MNTRSFASTGVSTCSFFVATNTVRRGVHRRVSFPDDAARGEDLKEERDFVGADGDVEDKSPLGLISPPQEPRPDLRGSGNALADTARWTSLLYC